MTYIKYQTEREESGRQKERKGVSKRREIGSDLGKRLKTKGSQGDEKEKEGRVMNTEVSGQCTS